MDSQACDKGTHRKIRKMRIRLLRRYHDDSDSAMRSDTFSRPDRRSGFRREKLRYACNWQELLESKCYVVLIPHVAIHPSWKNRGSSFDLGYRDQYSERHARFVPMQGPADMFGPQLYPMPSRRIVTGPLSGILVSRHVSSWAPSSWLLATRRGAALVASDRKERLSLFYSSLVPPMGSTGIVKKEADCSPWDVRCWAWRRNWVLQVARTNGCPGLSLGTLPCRAEPRRSR